MDGILFGNEPNNHIQIHYIGPTLCYTFGIQGLSRVNITEFNIENGDIVIFCFGEIDCRCHVNKHITINNTYQNIIDNIVDDNYFKAIEENVKQFKNLYVCVYNVVPPVRQNDTNGNDAFPFRGTDEERKQYILYFNSKLKEYCSKYKYTFFDVYEKYVDVDGFLNKKYSDGNVHIDKGYFISDFLEDLKIKIKEKIIVENVFS